MKRMIIASRTRQDVERITIDFYNYQIEDEDQIEAGSNPKRVFKNSEVVIRDIKKYLSEDWGLTILATKVSDNKDLGSDSTYYDVDIKLSNGTNVKYLYFRISDHDENPLNAEPRKNFQRRKTRSYEGIDPKSDVDVDDLFKYHDIVVKGKAYNNYSKALNAAKRMIDEKLIDSGYTKPSKR